MNVENFKSVVELWKKAALEKYDSHAFAAGYFESMMVSMFTKLSKCERDHVTAVLLESSVFQKEKA